MATQENHSISKIDNFANRFDSDGYLLNANNWNKSLAEQLACDAGITRLREEHWQAMNYIRDYFHRLNTMPPPRRVCRQLGIEGHNINKLFGGCLTAWRIAGLPNPGDEAKTHLH